MSQRAMDDERVVLVEIGSLAPGGDAVGRQRGGAHDGRATFVAGAAPGELVRVRLIREKARVAWGELLDIERSSPGRLVAPCPLFGTCGGCQWQHVGRAVQTEAKRTIVERAMGTPVAMVEASPAFAYRDRARLTVGRGEALGYMATRSHEVVDVRECLLLSPALAEALPLCRPVAATLEPGAEIELQAGAEGVHVNVRTRRPPERLPEMVRGVIAGLSVNGRPCQGLPDVDVAEPGSPPLRIPAGGFSQVGRVANAALVAAVLEAVGPTPGTVVELHAGSGNFTRHLVLRADAVMASEVDDLARERGRRNVPRARWSGTPPSSSSELVLMDPPRQGADAVHLAVASKAAGAIVYVSCDPQTLRRDASTLREAGWSPARITALDLMPQTYHVEVVARFERR